MLVAIKNQLFTNWHPMRITALVLGIVLGMNWFINSAQVSGFLALFFLYQAITNTGCIAGQCNPDLEKTVDDDRSEFIEYEEIK